MITGEQVNSIRKRLGDNQVRFAQRFGVVQSTVARWETKGIPGGTAEVALKNLMREVAPEIAE